MPARSTLRDRRRQQTAREIQSAMLRLAVRDGYEAVTTEMIATEAGISPRTFFNYYPNKEAALVGKSPEIGPDITESFRQGTGPLIKALFEALDRHLRDSYLNRDTVRMIDTLLERSPELVPQFYASLQTLTAQLAELIGQRQRAIGHHDAELLADMITHALANAIRSWAQSETMPETDIASHARIQVERIGAIISDRQNENA